MRAVISLIQALLFIISGFAVQDSNFKFWVDRAAMDMSSTTDISFESMDKSEYAVTEEEKAMCREWFDENVLSTEKPAYDFKVGGRSFKNNIKDWSFSFSEESASGEVYRGGKTTFITVEHKKSDIVATVEATIYEDSASCDWVVYIKNNGEEKSSVISGVNGADCKLPTGEKSDVYFSKGSDPAPDDFELMKSELATIPMVFTANGGRTDSFMPYFNILGEDCGVVLAVGWTGQWYTSLAQRMDEVKVEARQEKFRGYLLPGEEIRTPLISLTFYSGDNALKGFNCFRDYTINCVYPEGTKQVVTTGIGIEVAGTTEEQVIQNVKNIPEEWTYSLDYAWVDAGWYPLRNDWGDSVGNWYADPARFPNGLGEISKHLEERGLGLLLWYEIERCYTGSVVYNDCIENEEWLILNEDDDSRNIVNFANDDCFEYITNFTLDSLRFNGVKCFRLDSNTPLLPYWQKADKAWSDGRVGIVENHYVTNLYKYLDTLLEEIPGLMIDNCASGGKRLDIEMSRRGIPLWRTDYNCMDGEGNSKPDIIEATQAHTYGISFWLPYNGTCAYVDGEYADRTNMISCSQRLSYFDIRKNMVGNYYPLTYGGTDTEKYLAMQFDTDAQEGMALIYKRENVTDNIYHLVLNGLESDALYEIYDYDFPDVKHKKTGKQLMTDGIDITINETPKAAIILYNVVK